MRWESDEQRQAVKEYTDRLIRQYSPKGSAVEANKNWQSAHCLKAVLSREEINAKTLLEQAAKDEEYEKYIAKIRREENKKRKEEQRQHKEYVESLMRLPREERLVSEYVDGMLGRKK